jgi:hypothetical protein
VTSANAALAQTIGVHFRFMTFNPHVSDYRALESVRVIYAFSGPAVLPMPDRREMGLPRMLRFLSMRQAGTQGCGEVRR